MRILIWTIFIISCVAVIAAVVSFIYGSQPCSGDGCIIHILQFFGVILLILFSPICWFTGKKLGLWGRPRQR
jgi:hypothetical protein